MFGFLLLLTLMDPKRKYGYQNLHHLFLMQVWALTKCERIGAFGSRCNRSLMNTSGMHRYQGVLVGGSPYFREMVDYIGIGNHFILHF